MLAACQGNVATPADPAAPAPTDPGSACTTEILGDVAVPAQRLPERLGEATVTETPTPPAREQ